MAGSFNRITIVGYLGRDPEVRYIPSGDQVADFSVATSERRTVQGQQQESTTWFRVSVFGKQAEAVGQYLHKGSQVYVEGTLSQRQYTSNDGEARTSLEVRARDVQFLDRKGGGSEDQAPQRANRPAPNTDDLTDLPF